MYSRHRHIWIMGVLFLFVSVTLAACGGGDSTPNIWTGTKQFGTTADDSAYGVAVDGSGMPMSQGLLLAASMGTPTPEVVISSS